MSDVVIVASANTNADISGTNIDSTIKKGPSYIRLIIGPLRSILVFTFFAFALVVTSSSVRLPFVRSLISCKSTISEDIIAANKSLYEPGGIYWSGSRYCDDKKYVVGEALAITSIMDGYRLALRMVTLPILGALVDSPYFGRRLTFILGMVGTLLPSLLFIFSKPIPQGARADAILIIAYTINGLFVDFGTVLNTMTADRTLIEERGYGYTLLFLMNLVGSFIGVLLGIFVQRFFLTDYLVFWIGLTLVNAFILLLSWFFIYESRPKLSEDQDDDQPKVTKTIGTKIREILKELEFIKSDYFLMIFTFGVFFAIAGISIWGILSSVTIAMFNWKQGDFGIVGITAGPFALIYLLLSPRAVKKFGAFPVFIGALGFMLVTAILISISLAIPSQIIFICAILTALPVPVALPAANIIISARYEDKGVHGRAQSVLAMGGALGAAVGIPLSGTVIYDSSATNGFKAALPFIISFLLVCFGIIFIYLSSKFYNLSSKKLEGLGLVPTAVNSNPNASNVSDTKKIPHLNTQDI